MPLTRYFLPETVQDHHLQPSALTAAYPPPPHPPSATAATSPVPTAPANAAPSADVAFKLPPFIFAGPQAVAPDGGGEVVVPGNHVYFPLPTTTPTESDSEIAAQWHRQHRPPPCPSHLASWHAKAAASSAETPLVSNPPLFSLTQLLAPGWIPSLSRDVIGHGAIGHDLIPSLPFPPDPPLVHRPPPPPPQPLPPVFSSPITTTTTATRPFGLPIYSESGFDLVNILSRVACRRNPMVSLGPVDDSCSFVVVDVRWHDRPIVYCSDSFCRLTGYHDKTEILGRNCRFLQSPNGHMRPGEQRHDAQQQKAVVELRGALGANKECQVTIPNFRKNGERFYNLLTVIPIGGGLAGGEDERDEVVYHVGFQVDVTQQPLRIQQSLIDGTYALRQGVVVPSSSLPSPASSSSPSASSPYWNGGSGSAFKDRRERLKRLPGAVSKEFLSLLSDPAFLRSVPISKFPASPEGAGHGDGGNHPLNLILLEHSPEFIHVLSLKGSFLYVAPSVRRVLGYEPEELLGKGLADICHGADVVPIQCELKEGASSNGGAGELVKSIDMLYRAREKSGGYVWVEARGRLFFEQGKGKKAFVMSGRARRMVGLDWGLIGRGGGVKECWFSLGKQGTVLVAGEAVAGVLGWDASELVGRNLSAFLVNDGMGGREMMLSELARMVGGRDEKPRKFWAHVRQKGSASPLLVLVVFYRPTDVGGGEDIVCPPSESVLCQMQVVDGARSDASGGGAMDGNVFEEMDTARESCWQFELHQVKYGNERLKEEIAMLENRLQSTDHLPPPPPAMPATASNYDQQDWGSVPNTLAYNPSTWPSTSLKRAWDE